MDYDYKKQLKESFKQFPEFSKKILLLICRMCTLPGVTVRSFFEVIEQCFDKQPYQIQGEIDALLLGGWIYVVGEDIKAPSCTISASTRFSCSIPSRVVMPVSWAPAMFR